LITFCQGSNTSYSGRSTIAGSFFFCLCSWPVFWKSGLENYLDATRETNQQPNKENQMKSVCIDGKEYVERVKTDESYVIVRSRNAGVFAGELIDRTGDEVELRDARRLWYWSGAASLSQLSQEGVKNPNECKFPQAVPRITILGIIEVIPCTLAARENIEGVPVWKK
jgi:hypothetical protein